MAKLGRGNIEDPARLGRLDAERESGAAIPDQPATSASSKEPTKRPAKVVVPDVKVTTSL